MATVTLSTLRARVQMFLRDPDTKKWSADDLDTIINLAVRKWTTDIPIKSANDYPVVSDQNEYDMPGNAVSVAYIRGYFETAGTLEFIPPIAVKPGSWYSSEEPRGFIVDFPYEGKFYLPREPRGSTFTLYYGAYHNNLDTDSDTLDLRRLVWGEQAVIAYACFLAHLPYSASRARLEQWARKQDLNVGNPLSEEARLWLNEYNRLMSENSGPDVLQFVSLGRT